jgi:hypothetical protein
MIETEPLPDSPVSRAAHATTVRSTPARGYMRFLIVALAWTGLAVQAAASDSQSPETDLSNADIDQLVTEVQRMRERLDEMEALRARVRVLEQALEDARRNREFAAAQGADEKRDASASNDTGDAEVASANADDDPDGVAFKGALRFNAFWSDSDEAVKGTRGDSGLDLFRVGAEGSIDNVMVSAEYRFYPFMDAIHHGWIGYEFDNEDQVQVGITRVPFGLLPYASHNFWFGVPYYIGFADDYDLGVKYVHQDGPLDLQVAFFKNSELASATDLGRYSFDVVSAGQARNEEANQINARAAYTFGMGTTCSHEVGVSGQWGELYNFDTRRRGDHWAAAGHLDTRCGRWNLQLEAARFEFNPKQPATIGNDTLRLGGFETSYDVAAKGTFGVANIAYNVPIDSAAIDQLICYNDYSVLFKDRSGFRKSQLNTTGCLVAKGPIFLYLDLIQANNMVFFGNGSLAGEGEDDWKTRFNVNIGYYW